MKIKLKPVDYAGLAFILVMVFWYVDAEARFCDCEKPVEQVETPWTEWAENEGCDW